MLLGESTDGLLRLKAKAKRKTSQHIGFVVTLEMEERIKRLVELCQQQDISVLRSDVLRTALEYGLLKLEKELGITNN